ncbi:hypothetical protein ACP275_13G147000 [Erythranthe tilingii]
MTTKLLQSCPNQKQAVDWADECMLRYSNESMFGILQTDPGFWMWNPNNATSPAQFKEDLRTHIDDLRTKAVSGGGMRKFAAGNATAPDFQDIYSLLQCTPDLSPEDCNRLHAMNNSALRKSITMVLYQEEILQSSKIHQE